MFHKNKLAGHLKGQRKSILKSNEEEEEVAGIAECLLISPGCTRPAHVHARGSSWFVHSEGEACGSFRYAVYGSLVRFKSEISQR